ncbi:MAG: carbamoyl-phosphate synthase large subunit [Candidatus Omnitrophica bacterium]|nr:carbamoyl-phosphate synthase large subunit [Candidatus Omnitrophota bacterium]
MSKRTDLKKIMIIGAGPIIIGQACEFDYSGSQACKALKEEGYKVVLVNSNPATIMTDPEVADATYIEPLTVEFLERIICKEKPDAILPTLGGQTGLNLAMKLYEQGILTKYHVEMLGAKYEVIKKAEDRKEFKDACIKVGLDVPKSVFAYTIEEAKQVVETLGFPCIIRPSFTLGGTGGGIAHDIQEFERIASLGIESSMIHEILIEESIEGWKEFELEVMRDHSDNVVIICSIENFDPMGVHTGDSITVAPAQTLTDVEYQHMRNASIKLIREIGVETGGSNIQFAVNPKNGRMVVIEMNPRVSRSSALASKATGFPIAKFAAKLAVGYSLDEIQNDITKETPACFEPTIDYVVVKIPRFTFEKFPEAKDILGIQMKSVGETMAIGRNFKEALQKGLRGLEIDHIGLDNKQDWRYIEEDKLRLRLSEPNASRIFYLKYALQKGMSIEKVAEISKIDIWFIDQMAQILELEEELKAKVAATGTLEPEILRRSKEYGFSDAQLGEILNKSEKDVRAMRKEAGIVATFKLVDTCAAEFEAYTPYYYSTYETEDEALINNQKRASKKKRIMILGGGPNRIGQGIEFDYCCCHAAFALKEMGFETIMVNSNPETVSTDYDTSDRLYFEPLTFEDVMNIFEVEGPDGVIVQFGGQTPLNLARRLSQAGVPIIGTSVDSIDLAENREHFSKLMDKLGFKQPENASTITKEDTLSAASRIGYPVLVRPSYVLGGRAMRIVYDEDSLKSFLDEILSVSRGHPVLIDKFLEDAQEVDVDAISDGTEVYIAGVMEHIENAGIHSGDSACVLPPHTLSPQVVADIKNHALHLAKALKVVGLMNVQFAVKNSEVYVLEVNPRASRTVPFVSKATGMPLAKIAAQIMAGKKLSEFKLIPPDTLKYTCVKESVLPFSRFSGVDIILGPEMKSTGEVMGIASRFGAAFAKSQMAAYQSLPASGNVFISVNDHDKKDLEPIARKLEELKFKLMATKGTAHELRSSGIEVMMVDKNYEGENNALTFIKKGEINLIINTPSGKKRQSDMRAIRAAAILHNIPCITTIQGAWAAVNGMEAGIKEEFTVESLQALYRGRV